jgi:hypothetical protein
MRYDTPIYFQIVEQGEYDAATGNYGDDVLTEARRYASVTDSGVQTLQLIYGELKEGSKTVRLQRPYTDDYDRIRIGDKTYRVDFARHQKSFVVSEVQ